MIIFLACMILGFEETLASTDCQFKGDMCAIRPECMEEKYRSQAMSDCYEVLDTAPLYPPNSSLSYLIHVDFAVVPDGEQPDDWIYTIYQRTGEGSKTKLTPLEEKCCNMKNATTDSCTLAPEKEYVAIFPTNEGFCEFRIIRDDKPLELCEEGEDIDGACLYLDDGAFFAKYEYYLTADSKEKKKTNEIPMDKCYFPAPNHLFNDTYETGKDGIKTEAIAIKTIAEKPYGYGYLIKQNIRKNCSLYQKVLRSNHSDFAYANWAKNTGSFVCYGYKFIEDDAKYFPKPYCMKMGYHYDPLTIALSVCCAVVLVLIVATVVIRIKLKRKMKKAESYLANNSMKGLHVGTDEKTKSMNDLVTDEEACPIPIILAVEKLAVEDEVQQNDTAYISKESDDTLREPDHEAIEEKVVCPKPIENGYLPKHDNSSFEHTENNDDVRMIEQTENSPYFSKGFGNQIGDPIIEKNQIIKKSPILDSYTSKNFLSGNTEEIHNQLINYSEKKDFESPNSKFITKYGEGLPGYIAKQNLIKSVD